MGKSIFIILKENKIDYFLLRLWNLILTFLTNLAKHGYLTKSEKVRVINTNVLISIKTENAVERQS
jgi:hypothetical protein